MADYEIFREQLAIKYPSYGHALWGPNPRNPDRPVQVGDVGFIRRGKFHRLFNALLPADDPSHDRGVPEYHEPLVPNLLDHLDTDSLARNNYCSSGVNTELDPGYHARPGDFPQVSFQYNGTRRAAVLSLPVSARREDTLARDDFMRWILKHIDSWFAFARTLGLGIDQMEEIILVTGCDRTKSWANVAFLGNQVDAQVSFGVSVEGPNTSINFQFSPENARGAVLRCGPEGMNLPENQCVFIRGFRVSRSFWILPRRLKAAAGPSSDPGRYGHDPCMEVISTEITKFRDPLHVLLDYIAEKTPDCDMVLAHDDDLATISRIGHGTILETLEPDVMMDLLRKSNIEIHQVLYDLSLNNSMSGLSTDMSNVKVAMLLATFQNLNTSFRSQWPPDSTPIAQNVDLGHTSDSRWTPPQAVSRSLSAPTIRGDTYYQKLSFFPTTLLNAAMMQFPSTQAKRGDQNLARARDLAIEYESVIAVNDRRIIEDRITHAEELKFGLNTKSGISKFLQARLYLKTSRGAYRYTKYASDRAMEMIQSHHHSENISTRVTRTARSLYRCFLSCKDAFPTPDMKDELAMAVWDEACLREGAHPSLPRQDGEFVYDNMRLITDMKAKIMHVVESLYDFDTGQAPESICRNLIRAQALRTKMTFVYLELNIGGDPHHPYRHPIIQKVINITWFKNKDDDGIFFYDYFSPIPIEAIALALTVIECCIDEWSTGTWKESKWSEVQYEAIYHSHRNSLHDLRTHGREQGGDLLAEIQFDLLKYARTHAGAPPDPIMGTRRFPIEVLEAAVEEGLPAYDQTSRTPGITVSDAS